MARSGIARTFQTIKLFANMTAIENVMVGCHTRSRGSILSCMVPLPPAFRREREMRERARQLLNFMEIADLAEKDALHLSFGQQRAVEFARALALQPRLMLLDEPASGLNMHETSRVGEIIRRIRDLGITVLIVEHDMSLIMSICDELLALSFGGKIAEGRPHEVQRNPEVVRVYLGAE